MKNINLKKLSISLLAITTIPAALLYTDYAISNQPQTVEIKEQVLLPRVTIERLSAGVNSSLIEGYAEVISSETLNVLAQVSGRVIWRSADFKVGKEVKKGTLLLRVEDSDYQATLANAEKALADAHLALLQEERKHKRAQVNWTRSEIEDTPSELALRKPQLAIAQRQYTAAQKAVEHAKNNLANTKIYAPFNAVITAREVTSGSYLSPGSSIGELKAADTAEVKVALSEREWQQLPDSLDKIEVDLFSSAHPSVVWKGRVSELSLVIDQSTRTRTLTVAVDSPLTQPTPLLLGSFVNIRLAGKPQPDSYVIASSSITADGYIWFEKGDQLYRHKSATLFANAKEIGIARGDLDTQINLVTKPLSHYSVGMKVAAVEGESNAK